MNGTRDRGPADQRGFALLVLLGIVGTASLAIVLAVQSFVRPWAERAARTDTNVETVQAAVRLGFRRNGVFPADLAAVSAAGGLELQGTWRIDPFGGGQDLGYTTGATAATVRGRGSDGVLNTGDDATFTVAAEPQVRMRQRLRLRLIRAVHLLRLLTLDTANGLPNLSRAAMRTATRDWARCRRQWLTATAAERATLTTLMNGAVTTVTGAIGPAGVAAVPTSATGAGGYMEWLVLPDARGVDGIGQLLRVVVPMGATAIGRDGTGGTDDDM
ncbi:MAG: hypothetical protein WAT39_18130 [Planctomycetota bacterium]